ncbi:amino acid adenylation domain-containing protein [Vibrio parahaemolyticus]|uniref:amino acid adenylation domain-containing protein n=1 Tax=Vibrio parahaemolyticus TaxID=670 RepID=UPI0015DA0F6C|nr:amino acid adenylation domain-containing protein [Vibrio parahaemolyticus]
MRLDLVKQLHEDLKNANRNAGPAIRGVRSRIYSSRRRETTFELSSSVDDVAIISALLAVLYRYGFSSPVIGYCSLGKNDLFAPRSVGVLCTNLQGEFNSRVLEARVKEALKALAPVSANEITKLGEVLVGEKNSKGGNPVFRVAIASRESLEFLREIRTDLIIVLDSQTNTCLIDCNDRLLTVGAISRFYSHLVNLLNWFVNDDEVPVKAASLLSEEELEQLRVLQGSPSGHLTSSTVFQMFSKVVEECSDDPAIEFGGKSYSYRELSDRACVFAEELRKKGVRDNDKVGVCLSAGVDQLTAVLAVYRIGAILVPLDATLPQERLARIASIVAPVILFCDASTVRDLEALRVQRITVDEVKAVAWNRSIEGQEAKSPPALVAASDIAYILFTSGTTGDPKGVPMTHGALANLVSWQAERSICADNARTLQRTSIAFDVGLQEIFSSWATGGCLVVIGDEQRADILSLPSILHDTNIERTFLPPVALRQLARAYEHRTTDLTSLKEIIVAGEQLRIDRSIVRLSRDSGVSIDNQYGPTETHVTTAFRLAGSPMKWPVLPPIGRPIKNSHVRILDEHMHDVPVLVVGEIVVGGIQVSPGYLGKCPEQESFVCSSNSTTHREASYYKTGDYGYWNEDGDIQFVGRRDEQIKIRGYRVELGEIEVALSKQPGVAASAVTTHTEDLGDTRIICHVVPKGLSVSRMRAGLENLLPEYMLPNVSDIVMHNSLPITRSGKVDKFQLKAPKRPQPTPSIEAAVSTESKIAQIFKEELNIEQVPNDSSFLDLGGDSLSSIQVLLAIEDRFGLSLPLQAVLRGSVRSLVDRIGRDEVDNSALKSREDQPIAYTPEPPGRTMRMLPNGMSVREIFPEETDYLYRDIFEHNTYAPVEINYSDSRTIIDVGAHIGLFTLFARKHAPKAKIVSIEPAPRLFDALFSNVAKMNGSVIPLNSALFDTVGHHDFVYYPSMPGMSTLFADAGEESRLLRSILSHAVSDDKISAIGEETLRALIAERLVAESTTVTTQTLSDVIRNLGIETIDILKIDVQKSELNILKGVEPSHWHMVRQVIIEAHDIDGSVADSVDLLERVGFSVRQESHPLHPSSIVKMLYACRHDR